MASPSPSPSPTKVSLKLVIDNKSKKVLFAEAGKESVDFLCNILTLPVGTVIRLLSKQGMAGCLSNLYQSIESLNDSYLEPNQHKDLVLKPMASTSLISNSLVHQFLTHAHQKDLKFYKCGQYSSHSFVSDESGIPCPSCSFTMTSELKLVKGKAAGGGFVKGVVPYMVMDDLVVKPMSTSTLLNMFNVDNVGVLEEKVVDLDLDKALKMLEISLQSKNVLTTVFL